MKILLLILILTFSFQSLTKADDIKDFEIEGMSIGDSLLDFVSINEIKENIIPYFKSKRKYYVVGIADNLKNYNQVEIYLKSNDKNYEIKSILGGVFIDNLDKCFSKKKEIVAELDSMFVGIEKMSDEKKHEGDASGNSKQYIDQYNINFPNHIRVECTEFSDQMLSTDLARNSLNVIAMTEEIMNWIGDNYK